MNTSSNKILQQEFELLRQEIITRYEQTGVSATGKWKETVTIEALPNGFTVVADNYLNGRQPGKAPPSTAIEKWIIQKGISSRINGEISVSSLAFLISRKIAREGWHPKSNTANIIQQVLTPARTQQILDKIAPAYVKKFTEDLTTALENRFK